MFLVIKRWNRMEGGGNYGGGGRGCGRGAPDGQRQGSQRRRAQMYAVEEQMGW